MHGWSPKMDTPLDPSYKAGGGATVSDQKVTVATSAWKGYPALAAVSATNARNAAFSARCFMGSSSSRASDIID